MMTSQEAKEWLEDMSNEELVKSLEVAKVDLAKASYEQPNTEWHEACFAGVLALCMEAQKRNIDLVTRH